MNSLLLATVHILINSALLLSASRIFEGIIIQEDLFVIITGGLLIYIGESFVKPILNLLSLPFILITFGSFRAVITLLILWFVVYIQDAYYVDSVYDLIQLSLFISIIGTLLKHIVSKIK